MQRNGKKIHCQKMLKEKNRQQEKQLTVEFERMQNQLSEDLR